METEPTTSMTAGGTGKGGAGEVFRVFLRLGLTSFGGPVAHLGYFREEFVKRRGWLNEEQYAQVVALCQFLPGPASSQTGFCIGLLRAGWPGAVAAFVAFTLPSAALLVLFASMLPLLGGPAGQTVIHGLKLVAVAVVAHAVLGMARSLCPDLPRRVLAVLAAAVLVLWDAPWLQLAVVAGGGTAGVLLCREARFASAREWTLPHRKRTGTALLLLFALLLGGLPLLAATWGGLWTVAEGFYRAGALVFGGGHVVLPLLEDTVVGSGGVAPTEFLAGYGAAQAVPGPMFSFAAYLGARLPGAEGGLVGAAVALLAIFLPGFLLVAGVLPWWRDLSAHPVAARGVAGVNAAVVGLLAAALYHPVWTGSVTGWPDALVAVTAFIMLVRWKISPLWIVVGCVTASVGWGLF